MEKLRIRKTVYPDKKLTYTQWCKLHNVSSQWNRELIPVNNTQYYTWKREEEEENNFVDRLLNKILGFFK